MKALLSTAVAQAGTRVHVSGHTCAYGMKPAVPGKMPASAPSVAWQYSRMLPRLPPELKVLEVPAGIFESMIWSQEVTWFPVVTARTLPPGKRLLVYGHVFLWKEHRSAQPSHCCEKKVPIDEELRVRDTPRREVEGVGRSNVR